MQSDEMCLGHGSQGGEQGREVFTGTLEELLHNDMLMARLSEADRDIPGYDDLPRAELLQVIADAAETIRRCQSEIESAARRLAGH